MLAEPVPELSRLKKRAVSLLALTAAAAGLFALAQPWRLAEERFERMVSARMSAQLGMQIHGAGEGAVAILPTPRVIATGVRASVDGHGELSAPRIRADLRILPLLAGRIEFSRITVFSPEINLALSDGPFDPIPLMTSTRLARHGDTPDFALRDATVMFRRQGRIVSTARNLNADIAARAAGEAVQASGSLQWRGELVSFALASDSPTRATLPMLNLNSELATVDFAASRRSASANGAAPRALEGQIQIRSPSMSRLSAWLASGSPVLLPLGMTELSGTVSLNGEAAEIRNAALTLGSDSLEGALDWRKRDGRWLLTGTLAGRTLSIGRPMSGVSGATVNVFDMASSQVVDIDDLLAHDIDLRLSLQRVRLPGLALSDVAAQIMATANRFDLAIANSGFYRGFVRGRASIGRTEAGVEVRGQVAADRFDLGLLTGELFDSRRMTGAGAFQASFQSSGRTIGDLLSAAGGQFAFTARNGDFAGTNLNDAMRRIERQPLAVMRDWRGGRTQFEEFVTSGTMANGTLEVAEGRANGHAYRLTVGGLVSLPERAYRLAGQVHSANAQSQVPFEVTGPIGEPAVQVNTRALLERSGAVAPFFGGRGN